MNSVIKRGRSVPGNWDRRQARGGRDARGVNGKGELERRVRLRDRRSVPRWLLLAQVQDEAIARVRERYSGVGKVDKQKAGGGHG
jgi:hypothetical protein